MWRAGVGLRGLGVGEEEGGALARLGLDPDVAAMTFDNSFADRQADAGAGVLRPRVQALEDLEED